MVDRVVGNLVGLGVAHVGGVEPLFVLRDPQAFAAAWKDLPTKPSGDSIVGRRHKIVTLVEEAEELVKTAADRIVFGRPTEVPFPEKPCYVSRIY